MFPELPARDLGDEALEALVTLMRRGMRNENRKINAGYTYLGQFIDHDLTFDPVSQLQRRNDPRELPNFRTPRFDLDSVYGSGPSDHPFLYDWDGPVGGVRLLVGESGGDGQNVPDLPRNTAGRALLGDPRNDENLLVAQLHLLMLQFHNRVVDVLRDAREWASPWDLFEEARRLGRWHYQWVVVHDFLATVAGPAASDVFQPVGDGGPDAVRLRYFEVHDRPAMPVEFSAAAFRFGHSMVRDDYFLSHPGPRVPLFKERNPTRHLEGFRPLPPELKVDWRFLFTKFPSMRIDHRIANPLFSMPPDRASLPRLNLQRGRALGLPSGADVARAMELDVLTAEDLQIDHANLDATPLWYYVLCEAEHAGGEHLGPVGGRIVAEVIAGLLQSDPHSYLRHWPAWRPGEDGLPDITRDFNMVQLVDFVGA